MSRHAHQQLLPESGVISITNAKAHLGAFFDMAFSSARPVKIKKGNRFVVLTPMEIPEPVPVIPPGSYTIDNAWADELGAHPVSCFVPGQ